MACGDPWEFSRAIDTRPAVYELCISDTIRYDTIEEINVESKAEYTA